LNLQNLLQSLLQALRLALIVAVERPTIVHVPVTSLWSFWKAVVFIGIAKTLRRKVVGHLHGGFFDQYYRGSSPRVQRLIRWGLEQPDVLLVLSEHWRRFVETEIRPRTRLMVLPNAVDPQQVDRFQTPGFPAENRYSRKRVILVAGELSRRKGVEELAQAIPLVVAQVPEAHFELVGRWVTPVEERTFVKRCRTLGVLAHVTLSGSLPYEETFQHLAKASVLVLPSHIENLPFVVIEAMASRLPVVATAVGGVPEMIEEGVTGFLVPVHDSHKLAERLIQLLRSPELCRRMGYAGRARFEERYSTEVVIQQLADLYTAVAAGPQREDQSALLNKLRPVRSNLDKF